MCRYGTALGIDRTNETSQSNYVTDPMDLEEIGDAGGQS